MLSVNKFKFAIKDLTAL